MSIAWTTVALLVFLLPGFLFFLGDRHSERFSRQTPSANPVSQLAGSIFVSLFIHGAMILAVNELVCQITLVPCVDLNLVLVTFQLEGSNSTYGGYGPLHLSESLSSHLTWVLTYQLVSCGSGYLAGHVYARSLKLMLGRRSWIYRLHPAEPVEGDRRSGLVPIQPGWKYKIGESGGSGDIVPYRFAHVLSSVKHDGLYVLYRGRLHDFGLDSLGRIAYLVLINAERCYLKLDADIARTDPENMQRMETEHNVFYIDQDNIENVVFADQMIVISKSEEEKLTQLEQATGIV